MEEIRLKGICLSMITPFKDASNISFDSLQYMVANAVNTASITINVHADVYAKLQGEGDYSDGNGTREEWQQLLSDATEKQITFATA